MQPWTRFQPHEVEKSLILFTNWLYHPLPLKGHRVSVRHLEFGVIINIVLFIFLSFLS
jgi:hypothetical protein